jgi:hypothetical protein
MKLVDILARELKVWPDSVFAITQDEGGALNGSTAEDPPFLKNTAWGSGAFYLDCPVNAADLFVLTEADDWAEAIVTHDQWQAAVDVLKAESASAWVGIGLPPIGAVCECHLPGELTNNYSWVEAKVIWHNGPTECAVIRSTSKLAWCDEFRPIRTPEQIAAEEQAKAIDLAMRMINTTTMVPGDQARQNIARHVVETMIKDGYRKFEIVEDK